MSKRLFQYNIHNHKTLFDQTPIENNLTTLLNGETLLCILTMKHMTALVTDKYSIHGIDSTLETHSQKKVRIELLKDF